jgi:YegS/Rv2252/BmrU family lipid kinase
MNPENGYISLILNPSSGASSEKGNVHLFIEYLESKKFQLQVNQTKSLLHARSLAAESAVKFNCAMVIVAGGDGTIREVVHGLEGSDKPLMLLPSGTENLLANELGYKRTLKNWIEVFESDIRRPLDLCKANNQFFLSVGGVGFDADVVKIVDEQRSGNITHLHYFFPILRTFLNYNFPKLSIEVDDKLVFSDKGIAIFGNISRYALGIPILISANYGDGLLDLCVCKCSTKLGLIYHSLLTILKMHQRNKRGVIYKQCKKVKIYSDEFVRTELDGDPGPDMPLDITVIPHAVNILVPPKGKPIGMRRRIFRIFE